MVDLTTAEVIYENDRADDWDVFGLSPGGVWLAATRFDLEAGANSVVIVNPWGNVPAFSPVMLTSPNPGSPISALQFSQDGRILAAGFEDGWMALYSFQDGVLETTPLYSWQGHQGPVKMLELAADNRLLVSYSLDGYITLWGMLP
jgi:WD40 repeat protein